MAKTFKTISALRDHIKTSVARSLETEVGPEIESMLVDSATKNVIGPWSRLSSNYSDFGNPEDPPDSIASPAAMSSSVTVSGNRVVLRVKDTAKPQKPIWSEFRTNLDDAVGGTMFSRWIEYGEWMDLRAYESSYNQGQVGKRHIVKQKRPARPFVKPVQDELNANPSIVLKSLKRGLKGRL